MNPPFQFPHTKSMPSFFEPPPATNTGFQPFSQQKPKEPAKKLEKILAKRLGKTNKPEYLIKWAAESPSQPSSTWESLSNLTSFQREIESFEQEWAKLTAQVPQKTVLSLKRYGSFAAGDAPEEILGLTAKNNVIIALIRWKIDQNGVRPLDSFVSTKVLREKAAVLLVNFYEKKIQF